jgi:hypothetical protein
MKETIKGYMQLFGSSGQIVAAPKAKKSKEGPEGPE